MKALPAEEGDGEKEGGEEGEGCGFREGEFVGDEFEGDDVEVVSVLGVAD